MVHFRAFHFIFGPLSYFRSDFGPIFDRKIPKSARTIEFGPEIRVEKWIKIDSVKNRFNSKFSSQKPERNFRNFPDFPKIQYYSQNYNLLFKIFVFQYLFNFFSLSCFSDFFAKNLFHRFSKTEIIEKGH